MALEGGWMVLRSNDGRTVDVTPSARRLTDSLRHIGYEFVTAVADLADNSVAADARSVDVDIQFDGARSRVMIADDGVGMTERQLNEALRFGTRRSYGRGELGRFGLGLKTASISQCRRLTVVTRHSPAYARLTTRCLDLDYILGTDRWEIIEPPPSEAIERAKRWLLDGPGTVVIWESLDRVLPAGHPEGGWARRRLETLARRTGEYLGMVFHRYIEGETARDRLTVSVNGAKVAPWNPFARGEDRLGLPPKRFELEVAGHVGQVWLHPFVLPPRSRFSTPGEFERLSGPLKWNRQQGLYIYRADRLIQSGGWCGLRAADEHTKLARAALDFDTDLDPTFQVNVAKMRVTLPPDLRPLLESPIQDLCHQAEAVYRREPHGGAVTAASPNTDLHDRSTAATRGQSRPLEGSGLALRAAAMEVGESEALGRIMERLRERSPDVASSLGW
jgi:Histidine kinase-, DNA gyrase B-, and HSP90-like ATPase